MEFRAKRVYKPCCLSLKLRLRDAEAQYDTAQHSTGQHHTAQTAPYRAKQQSPVQNSRAQHIKMDGRPAG